MPYYLPGSLHNCLTASLHYCLSATSKLSSTSLGGHHEALGRCAGRKGRGKRSKNPWQKRIFIASAPCFFIDTPVTIHPFLLQFMVVPPTTVMWLSLRSCASAHGTVSMLMFLLWPGLCWTSASQFSGNPADLAAVAAHTAVVRDMYRAEGVTLGTFPMKAGAITQHERIYKKGTFKVGQRDGRREAVSTTMTSSCLSDLPGSSPRRTFGLWATPLATARTLSARSSGTRLWMSSIRRWRGRTTSGAKISCARWRGSGTETYS